MVLIASEPVKMLFIYIYVRGFTTNLRHLGFLDDTGVV